VGQFEEWTLPQRNLLLHDLSEIIVLNRICGFVSFVETIEYDQWCKENPRHVSWIGSPYTACLMRCVETAGIVARQKRLDGSIDYVFESGCAKQKEASEFMTRLVNNPALKAGLRVGNFGFAAKSRQPILCTADFLCWEWQRNYVESTKAGEVNGNWRSELKILLSPDPTEIYPQKISKQSLSSQAITNAAHRIV
jgi:hypothetical protein